MFEVLLFLPSELLELGQNGVNGQSVPALVKAGQGLELGTAQQRPSSVWRLKTARETGQRMKTVLARALVRSCTYLLL